VSPKFANSTPKSGSIEDAWIQRHEDRRWQPPVLDEWVKSYHHQFKLVVGSEADANEALVALKFSLPALSKDRIFLMPEGTTVEALTQRQSWLIDFCKDHGYRYCNRLHIELFGNTRGT
jgi:7-carboxy-7-deazaguanine synthase